MLGTEEINNRMGFHKPSYRSEDVHQDIREMFKDFMGYLDKTLPPGRYRELALTELEGTAMWCHKAVAQQDPAEVAHELFQAPAEEPDHEVKEMFRKVHESFGGPGDKAGWE